MSSRSQLIALARLLNLIDAESARALVVEARANRTLANESQREALQHLVEANALSGGDLETLGDFAATLSDDLQWVTHHAADNITDDQRKNGRHSSELAFSGASDASRQLELGQSTEDELELSATGSESSKSRRRDSHSRSSRGKSSKSHEPDYEWNEPTLGTKFALAVRKAPRTVAGITKYWTEAIQDWVASNLAAAGAIAACFMVAIVGLASWSYFANSRSSTSDSNAGQELVEAAIDDEPEDRLQGIQQLVRDGDFDAALKALKALQDADATEGKDSADLACVESGLLLAERGEFEWENGGETAWKEAGNLLLADPQIDSPEWRLQFATWLIHASDEDRARAMETLVVNYPVRGAVNYQLKAWMQVRSNAPVNALRFLSEIENENCEIGDLLYRAVANFYVNQLAEAKEDFATLDGLLLANADELNFHQQVCFPELQIFARKFSRRLEEKLEQSQEASAVSQAD